MGFFVVIDEFVLTGSTEKNMETFDALTIQIMDK